LPDAAALSRFCYSSVQYDSFNLGVITDEMGHGMLSRQNQTIMFVQYNLYGRYNTHF